MPTAESCGLQSDEAVVSLIPLSLLKPEASADSRATYLKVLHKAIIVELEVQVAVAEFEIECTVPIPQPCEQLVAVVGVTEADIDVIRYKPARVQRKLTVNANDRIGNGLAL